VNTVNFANGSTAVHNLTISTASYNQATPGGIYTQKITIVNEGTVKEDSAFAGYKSDGQLFSPVFTPSPAFSGSAYYYNNLPAGTSLDPGASATFYVDYHVPANMAAGTNVVFRDTVANKAPVTNWLSDNTPANNINTFITTVVSSSNPDFKEVVPKGSGANGYVTYADSVLTYTVHFENTGSSYAQNVMVVDTIDNNLDWTSLHPIYESAPCRISVKQAGTAKIAVFNFDNILLAPQSFNDKRSGGTFTYSLKMMSGLSAGAQFRNRSTIFFDRNAPFITNTTLNTLTNSVIVDNTAADRQPSFAIYPNPAGNSFNSVINCMTSGSATMAITDVMGKNILVKTVSVQTGSQVIATDVSQFVPGIYFVSFNQNGKTETQKLVIIR
jgi:uncharacterized repeat protein (TIGR01451 family)